MIIEKIDLFEVEVVEIEGEYKQIKRNERTVPAMLTNYAIEQGKRRGLLKTSLISELFAMYNSMKKSGNPDLLSGKVEDLPANVVMDMGDFVDESKISAVIYLACIGANPKFDLSYDDFLMQYNADLTSKMQTYMNLIVSLQDKDKNAFAQEFKNLTKADSKKK